MEILEPSLLNYAEEHTSPEDKLLSSVNRETNAKVMMPRMLSGHLQGKVLMMISHMVKPKTILEIGTYTGYSAICLAAGLQDGGKLITIDINEELESMVRNNFQQAGLGDKIEYRIGNALEINPALEETLDLVNIDADKENYNKYKDIV
jgi:predicted O-methyltransferase YrrM